MGNPLTERQLWVALSQVFVDTEIDFPALIEVAKHFTVEEVKFAFFERVAPVCIGNMLTAAPPVWWSFEENELVGNIERLIAKRARQGPLGRLLTLGKRYWIRLICLRVWADIRASVEKANTV